MVGVGGFPRTALSRRLRGIPDDLTAHCLSNLLIVEPVVLISPLHHKIKMPRSGHFYFGGSGWIRTTSGLSQQIYSLPRLSNSGARPISIPPAFANGFGGQWISTILLVRAAGLEPAFQAWKACILALVLCPQQIQSHVIIY